MWEKKEANEIVIKLGALPFPTSREKRKCVWQKQENDSKIY